jgi:hypothetical protein
MQSLVEAAQIVEFGAAAVRLASGPAARPAGAALHGAYLAIRLYGALLRMSLDTGLIIRIAVDAEIEAPGT